MYNCFCLAPETVKVFLPHLLQFQLQVAYQAQVSKVNNPSCHI